MWTQTDFLKERNLSFKNHTYSDETNGTIASNESDFSPVFWLASAPAQGGEPPPVRKKWTVIAGVPLSYPVLIGFFLIFAYLVQRNSLSFM